MKHSIRMLSVIAVAAGLACADDGPVLFSDSFDAEALGPQWQVKEGEWTIADGALTNAGGGLIVLDQMPGNRFVWEAEVNLPGNWTSLILFYETPNDYGTLYFGGGYWESFELENGGLANYIQRRDETITPGVDHVVRMASDCGRVALYYDGVLKGEADLRPRAGSRLAFRNIERGGLMRIGSVRLSRLTTQEPTVVGALRPEDVAEGAVFSETGLEGTPGNPEPLRGGLAEGLGLEYGFAPGDDFESRCARLPLEAGQGKYVLCDVEGDGSGNKLFIIVHDRTGEQHLVGAFALTWTGWQECAANLTAFLESPPDKQRLHTRWEGDENQRIDFPITKVDVGVAKRWARGLDKGLVRFRNLRVVE